jgi:hypothetical protein
VTITSPSNGATPTRAEAEEPSVGQLVSDATKHLSDLVHSEIELAKLELSASVKNAGTGAGMFAGAAVLLVFSLTFLLLALAEGFHAMGFWMWVSYLLVFLILVVVIAILAWLGYKKVQRVKGPERTMTVTQETVEYLKTHTKLS